MPFFQKPTADFLLNYFAPISVSPPGGDFSDPVTSATLGIVQVDFRCISDIMGSLSFLYS